MPRTNAVAAAAKTSSAASSARVTAPAARSHSSSSSAAAATPIDDADAGGKIEDLDSPSPDAQEDANAAPKAKALDGVTVADMMKQMKAMSIKIALLEKAQSQQQPQSLSLDASSSSSDSKPPHKATDGDVGALVRAMQESQTRQVEQAFKQQAASSAQLLLLQSLGTLPSFTSKGGDTTLLAQEWLQRAEDFFAAREHALGIDAVLADQSRVLTAAYALQDDARRWYDALPKQPSSWPAFRDAVKDRFCSVPSERIRVDKLRAFVEKTSRLRDKLNLQGMQAFTAHFAQLAGQVPAEYVTHHEKLALLARGLPQRYAEVVMQEDAKKPLPPLHEVINTVLARAAFKQQAASYGGAFTSSGSSPPINIDAISLAVATFGWTREEAQSNLHDSEGWAPYDTHGSSSSQGAGPASAGPPPPMSSMSEQIQAAVLNALAAAATRVGAGPAARERNQSRRNGGVAKEIPSELVEARKDAGLCIRCGVVAYEPGSSGHNAATCHGAVDRTTSAEDGIKQAGL